jgi:molybdopterin molybdotransferase
VKLGRPDLQRRLKLIPYEKIIEAIETTFSGIRLDTEEINVDLAQGRICSEAIVAEKSIPSVSTSAMDGYVLKSIETQQASINNPVHFKIIDTLFPASCVQGIKIMEKESYYVSTGAPLPENGDAVIKAEDTRLETNEISVIRSIAKGKNVVPVGQDVQAGTTLFNKGHIFNAADIALLISASVSVVKVFHNSRVGILSVGDELREFRHDNSSSRQNNQLVYHNNFFNLMAGFLREFDIDAKLIGICEDDENEIKNSILRYLDDFDMILAIGGSSVGIRDYTPDALLSIEGSKMIFHGIMMIPIKPAGLVVIRNKPIAIVPAHASSATFCFFLIVLPILNLMSGLRFDDRRPKVQATCEEQIENPRPLPALALLQLKQAQDECNYASHLGWYSNLMSNVSKSNGFVIMKPYQIIRKAENFDIELLGSSQLNRIQTRLSAN